MNVPSPWWELGRRPDITLARCLIPERGRYYHRHRLIVVRQGLLLCEERSVLWHELVHADRGDEDCSTSREHYKVVTEASLRAMPWEVLEWGVRASTTFVDLVDRMKVEERMVRTRLQMLRPGERRLLHEGRAAMGETA